MRLFWKIFLSFWLLVTTLVIVVLVTNWNRRSDRFDYFRQQQIALVGNSTDFAVAEYEREGAPGLEHALSRINTRINGELWILDDNSRPIQGGELPKAIQPALTMTDDVTASRDELLVRLPFEHEGKRYMALARLRMRKPPPLPFFRDPAAQIPLGVLLSSIVCFVLARWIARPVSALRRSAQRISPADSQRIQRALEVWRLTGKPLSALHGAARSDLPFRLKAFALVPRNRAELHERIAARFARMLQEGLVDEVKALRKTYRLTAGMPSMRAVGYRQVWQHLEGEIDAAALAERAVAATRQLAKRQLTWLRGFADVEHLDASPAGMDVEALASRIAHSFL